VYPHARSSSNLNLVCLICHLSNPRGSSRPVFSWRTTLSSTLFNTSPRLSLLSLHADLASCLLTYAFSLSNLARSSVASLGAYEYERGISEVERKQKDEKLNFAVTLLCRASGIFSHLADSILPEWDRRLSEKILVDKGPSTNRPPDLSREVNNALAKFVPIPSHRHSRYSRTTDPM
jgi:hypothetical protein